MDSRNRRIHTDQSPRTGYGRYFPCSQAIGISQFGIDHQIPRTNGSPNVRDDGWLECQQTLGNTNS